ncbi:MAG: hypothetical protein ACYDD7_02600, partial [Acidimicrobiales bacterium]
GSTAAGSARIERHGREWSLVNQGTPAARLINDDVIALVVERGFIIQKVELVPDLPELLFKKAIAEAEIALREVNKASEAARQILETGETLVPFVLGSVALDRAVAAGAASIIMAIAAGEAQVNQWADVAGGWQNREDKLAVDRKCVLLGQRAGVLLDLRAPPLRDLTAAVTFRNQLVHSRPVAQPFALTGPDAPVPGRSISVAARRACLSLRESLLAVAGAVGTAPPAYLAYCPHGDVEDDEVWSAASVMTGTRADPDFPPMSAQTSATPRP